VWCKALPVEDLWEGDIAGVDVGGQELMLVKLRGGELRAYQGRCPHQGVSLASGEFDGRFLSCRAHAWQFDLLTGRGVNPASCVLARFPVSVEDEHIFVEVNDVHRS
jgi:toluene monooxygenase system ferredoxin subunit